MKPDFKSMLDSIVEEEDSKKKESTFHKHSRVMFIDGLNLFFRNFATLNYINQGGVHIGGLGGFLRSLGSLIKQIQPTSIYVVFDGLGSSTNRKNLMPEYKSNRGIRRITNWDIFDSIEDEEEAKFGQISRLIHYLKCLPVTLISVDKAEADDVIAYLAKRIPQIREDAKSFIVSSDKDYLQLVTDNITVFRPVEREYYTVNTIKEKIGVLPENYIIVKTLTGDNSDMITGVRGLGIKTVIKLFPELKTEYVSFKEVMKISESKYKDNVKYSKILLERHSLEKNFRIMNLHSPLLDENQISYLEEKLFEDTPKMLIPEFSKMHLEDGLEILVRNPTYWISDTFKQIKAF